MKRKSEPKRQSIEEWRKAALLDGRINEETAKSLSHTEKMRGAYEALDRAGDPRKAFERLRKGTLPPAPKRN